MADDDGLVREAYRSFFEAHPDLSLVGEATNGAEAVAAYGELHPDLVVMDLQMPLVSGVEATRSICSQDPHACVVAMTTFSSRDHVVAALEAGAAGYLVKGVSGDQFMAGLRQALAGDMPLSPAVRRQLVTVVRSRRQDVEPVALPPRQLELLRWLALGLTNRQIARRMHVSEGSIKQYLARAGEKLDASSRTQLLIRAIQSGLVDPYDVT